MAVRQLGSELEPLLADEWKRVRVENISVEELAELYQDSRGYEITAPGEVDERQPSEPHPPAGQKRRKPNKREKKKPGR